MHFSSVVPGFRSRVDSALDRVALGRTGLSIGAAATAFAALLFPAACVVCGRWDTSLCRGCSRRFRSATARPFRAEGAAEALPDVMMPPPSLSRSAQLTGAVVRDDGPATPDGYEPLPVLAAGRYGRAVSAVLLAYKNHGHLDLAGPVAAALAGALHEGVSGGLGGGLGRGLGNGRVLLVPVPTRGAARRRHGYDPLMVLLVHLERRGQLPAGAALAPWLAHVPLPQRIITALRDDPALSAARLLRRAFTARMSGGQKGAGRRRRRSNVMRSMAVREGRKRDLAGRRCLVLDDVLTTGATIGEAHRALVAAGATVMGAVVVAATRSPAGSPEETPAASAASSPGTGTPPPTSVPFTGNTRRTTGELPEVRVRQGMNNGEG